ncbi:MAG: hypothetical protein HY905_25220 [Deltaproteobacteria bacterium]|nr:hypothetical protein [Deltaproteobacteria bacterium]
MRTASSTATRVILVILAVAALLPMIRLLGGGLWEPWELHRAEAARQVASGETPAWAVPEIEGEGERPPLATWVTAAGFDMGGEEVGNGKAAVALFLLLCVLIALVALGPLLTPERALAGFAVFFALPVVFLQGASAGGDAVAFGAYAVAFAGLTRLLEAPGWGKSAGAEYRDVAVGLLVAGIGLTLSYFALGAVLGVMVPLGAAAIATAVAGGMRSAGAPDGAALPGSVLLALRWLAAAVAAGLCAWFVVKGLLHQPSDETERFALSIGGAKIMNQLETFEVLLARFGYETFPWCALAPLAVAWMVVPRNGESGAAANGSTGSAAASADTRIGRHAILHVMLGYTLLAYWSWRYYPAPTIIVFPLALVVGDYLLSALRDGRGLRLAGAITVLVTVVVLRDAFGFEQDFLELIGFPKPADVLSGTPTFPMSLAVVSGVFLVVVIFTHLIPAAEERQPVLGWYREQWRQVREGVRGFLRGGRGRWDGAWAPAGWLAGVALVGGVLGTTFVARYTEFSRWTVTHFGFRAVVLLFGVVPLCLLAIPFLWRASRQIIRWMEEHATAGALRGAIALGGGLAVSLVSGMIVAPALDANYSLEPAARAAAAEGNLTGRLYLLQVEPAATRYYPSLAGGKIVQNLDEAVAWLAAATREKPRFLVFPSKNQVLNEVNQKYRDRRNGALLPVISDPNGRYLLAVSDPEPGEANRSPLARVLLLERPTPEYPVLESNFDNKVRYLGYDITSYPDGTVAAFDNVTITHYWECTKAITGDYEVFVHIDGMGDRINGDHEPAEGLYPTRYWRPGDVIIDRQQLRIPFFARPSVRPDAYTMYVGMFRGEARMPLVDGEGNDNRLYGGVIRVR